MHAALSYDRIRSCLHVTVKHTLHSRNNNKTTLYKFSIPVNNPSITHSAVFHCLSIATAYRLAEHAHVVGMMSPVCCLLAMVVALAVGEGSSH